MKGLTCELCGSNDLVKQDGVFVCQSCNTKYSVEEAKKLMFGTRQTPAQNEADLSNLYELARNAKNANNNEVAKNYYAQIAKIDQNSWEAHFYNIYFEALSLYNRGYKISKFALQAESTIDLTTPRVLELVQKNVNDETEQRNAINEISDRLFYITDTFNNLSKYYYEHELSDRLKNRDNKYVQDYVDKCYFAATILYTLGDELIGKFGDKYSDIAVKAWKKGIEYHMPLMKNFVKKEVNQEKINGYADKILKYDPNYERPTFKKKGLFGRFR